MSRAATSASPGCLGPAVGLISCMSSSSSAPPLTAVANVFRKELMLLRRSERSPRSLPVVAAERARQARYAPWKAWPAECWTRTPLMIPRRPWKEEGCTSENAAQAFLTTAVRLVHPVRC